MIATAGAVVSHLWHAFADRFEAVAVPADPTTRLNTAADTVAAATAARDRRASMGTISNGYTE
jgi:hypothetical protein